ncbi:MAG: biosynthetic-type acetolactate synthase large subunit [Deltaproteobacteria bacterium]|nr:biosynthetic-type acetolactate synthase large subunit [Deltaproteobacteria bacterium]
MKLTGAQIFIQALKDEGVDLIFGYPGGAILHVYDELYKHPEIRHVLVRHEQGAVHAADGYARVTCKPGVALVTSGPGATNTVTGLATALMDSIPMVVISGQVPLSMIGNDAFQEADIVGITRPCTKHNYLVKDVRDLQRIMKEAFHIARTGRPGPVLVDIPKDLQLHQAEYVPYDQVKVRSPRAVLQGHSGQIKKGWELLKEAKRPLLYVGGGAVLSQASDELKKFAYLTKIPVAMTLMGLGAFPGTDDLSLGMLGMHGTYYSNMSINECDVLFSVGARFDDRVTGKLSEFSKHSKKIHIDIDPANVGKSVAVDVPIVGDVKYVLGEMLKMAEAAPAFIQNYHQQIRPWWEQIRQWREKAPMGYQQGPKEIRAQYVIDMLYQMTKGEAIVTTDVGQHQMWAAQFYHFKEPHRWCTSGGLGTMGFGFPAAIGAQLAYPEKTVICISGDGSIQMNIQELATAVEWKTPVIIAILNNHFLGMVRQWQELFYENRYSEVDLNVQPDFVKLAEAYGAVGLRASVKDEVVPVIERALKVRDRPVVIDFVTTLEDNVYPMVPAGGAVSDIVLA